MLTLYVKTGCPFCGKVLSVLNKHNVSFEEKNIADEAVEQELIETGGKRQVPFLVDGNTNMYESDAIIKYIHDTYVDTGAEKTENKFAHLKLHRDDDADVCESCQ